MNRELKNFRAAERWIVKKLRAWLDRADEFVHAAEVRIREESKEIDARTSLPALLQPARGVSRDADKTGNRLALEEGDADCCSPSPSPVPKLKRKRRMTAAEFDLDIRNRVMARAGAL